MRVLQEPSPTISLSVTFHERNTMAENNSEVIEAAQPATELCDFIESKKGKREPSKADGQEFERLWLELAENSGINDTSISLLCKGFRFCAARPLFAYFKKNAVSPIPYTTLGSYPAIKANNTEIALRMYLSLLALEIIDPTSNEQIAWLVKRIPEIALNKEGKVSGNMNGYIRKLLVQEIAGKATKTTNVKTELSADEASRFAKLIVPILDDLAAKAKLTISEQSAVEDLTEWASSFCEAGKNEESIAAKSSPAEARPSEAAGTPGAPEVTVDGINTAQVVAFVQRQERRIELLRSANSSASAEVGRLKEDKKLLREQNASIEERLEKARETITSQNARITELEELLGKTSADLAAHQELVDMLDQDKTRESDEAMTRVARKLKIEYQDYQDAVDMDMSVDLGENMRLQLGEVFRILKESGFAL